MFFADSSDVFVMVKMSIKSARRVKFANFYEGGEKVQFLQFSSTHKKSTKEHIYVSQMHQIKGNFVYYTNK